MPKQRRPGEIADDQPTPFFAGCRYDDPGLRNPAERLNGDSVLVRVDSLDADGTARGWNFVTREPFVRKRSKGKPVLDRYYLLSDEEGEYRRQAFEEDLPRYGERTAWATAKQLSLDYYRALKDGSVAHCMAARTAARLGLPPPPPIKDEPPPPPPDQRQALWDEIVAKSKTLRELFQGK
jgi:hypothetical protein